MNTAPMNPGNRPTPPPSPAKNNDQTIKIILIAALVLLLGLTGFFATKYYGEKGKNEQQLVEIDTLNSEISDLETKIKGMESEIEGKNLDITEKDRLLDEKLQELQTLQKKLSSAQSQGKISSGKAKELQDRISSLEGMITAYKEEIERLKEENVALSGQVSALTEENASSKQKISEIQQNNEAQKAQIAKKEEEKVKVEEEKAKKEEELALTTQAASVLRAADFRFFNVKKSDKEKEEMDKEFKRMWMQSVKICFTVMENLVAQPGAREVYLVYENPDGTVRTTASSGKFKYENRDISYSTKTNFNFNRSAQELCMSIPKPEKDNKYQKGEQVVTVFCDGKMIGRGKFEIK